MFSLAQVAMVRVPGCGDPAGHPALHADAAEPDLYGRHSGEAAVIGNWPEKGAGDCGRE